MNNNLPNISLVLGGARSGKSQFAENLALKTELDPYYFATSQAYDTEMKDRISKHQIDRGDLWATLEEPLELSTLLLSEARPERIILVDCLTLWVTNLMMAEKDIVDEFRDFIDTLHKLNGPVIFVSNEVGQGIVPDNAMARAFRDYAGRLHQDIAAIADDVYFITAGLQQRLK
ncbi:bifunctional adenosylcobinamide kinase/adenosylcobinamide-phosphate guanylyltransferase [Alphaproteobacteria bacterium 46_93_T64]|nr:bifunctional adenosylcobinamide kinase/adenosylcobinamide-phosphate guanylyltransferase [Alphaproteobacteria bacterium 46_93_T64]